MFNKLSSILSSKFSKKDDLSRQVEIARVLDLCRGELKKIFPEEEIEVVSLKDMTLLIRLQNSNLASELRLREYDFIKNINTQIGKESLRRVIYRF
ncbi:MAG: hypothetical protein A2846_01940 [Candidatus Doudnabacteria bacterium RIFCSPHIGHO2_01_FULL_49_9]|uniref:DUF721 domain-containing protein n=1 Tax=Candidatus Doudnabacteria bacterium RIFCSPHIGHO2_01_FULL_49_9 TaxID=1817827 RepID=A0A1F5P350_9BACT|nr:MAG: hypothetical protein A2846_01940 [Candidatus Doudnabacteria bacterium RIFCSPHIGHO2_01_FULL_49_9]